MKVSLLSLLNLQKEDFAKTEGFAKISYLYKRAPINIRSKDVARV